MLLHTAARENHASPCDVNHAAGHRLAIGHHKRPDREALLRFHAFLPLPEELADFHMPAKLS